MLSVQRSEDIRALRDAQRASEVIQPLRLPPRATWNLSEVVNDSVMTGTTATDVFNAGVTPVGIVDTAADLGTIANGFARADHVHAHPALRGGDAHALASAATHGFMDKADKAALDALVTVPALDLRVFRSPITGGLTLLLVSDTAYFVFVGRTPIAYTPKFVEAMIQTSAIGAQTAEVGLFSSASAPAKAGLSLTKIVSTGTVDALTAASGTVVRNTAAFATAIAAGTFLWAGVRTAMTVTQPTLAAVAVDMAQGYIQSTAAAGVLTAAGPWTGAIITPSLTGQCPDLRVTLD